MFEYTVKERAALEAALSRLNIELDSAKQELLLKHVLLVHEKNKVLNLTRIDSIERAIVLHIEDSLSVLREFGKEGMFCDIGTGGGFPGIPLGIVSGRHGVLLDSVQKKAVAVQGFIDELGMSSQLECVGVRSEGYAEKYPCSFSTVIARAVAALNVVQELATPLLHMGGRLVAMRGHESDEEREYAEHAAQKLGLELVDERMFFIGEHDSVQRTVFVYQRVREAQVKVPRRPGMAAKRPYR